MKQIKKPLYHVYPQLIEIMYKAFVLALPKQQARSFDRHALFKAYFAHNADAPAWNVNRDIVLEECFWESQGKHVIFPESSNVLDNLLRARYSLDSAEGFTLPLASFVLAMTSGYSFAGITIPPLSVAWVHGNEYEEHVMKPFHAKYRLLENAILEHPQEFMMCITYPEDVKTGVFSRVMLYASDLPHLLSCSTPDEFKKVMIDRKIALHLEVLTENDFAIQFYAMKLISALGVYNMATDGKRLRDGYPTQQPPKMVGVQAKREISALTLSNSIPAFTGEDHSVSPHYRSWYFRQLKAERYYQGDFAKAPKGSRYTFVSETMVGRKITPSTQC